MACIALRRLRSLARSCSMRSDNVCRLAVMARVCGGGGVQEAEVFGEGPRAGGGGGNHTTTLPRLHPTSTSIPTPLPQAPPTALTKCSVPCAPGSLLCLFSPSLIKQGREHGDMATAEA